MEKTEIDKVVQAIDFAKLDGLIPVVTEDFESGGVLMLGFMNEEALRKTLSEDKVTYFSRTRQKLWTKGESSGNFQKVREVWLDCDDDSLLIKVDQTGQICHTGEKTCFFKKIT